MRAKKSLGQNFLTSVGAVQKIVAASDYAPGLTVLEVGPGRGVLTEALLQKFDKVVAVEKDRDLILFLEEKFAEEIRSGQLTLIEGDILELKPSDLNLKDYSIIANIPYYITGQFLRLWLSHAPKYMVLMLQKEVAKRIVAVPSTSSGQAKESLLSISVKLYGQPEYIETVKRGSFNPAPNVDSAILKIANIRNPDVDENRFFTILKTGFAHKRKLLASNLGKNAENSLQKCSIDPKSRAESLKLEDWKCLTSLSTDFLPEE